MIQASCNRRCARSGGSRRGGVGSLRFGARAPRVGAETSVDRGQRLFSAAVIPTRVEIDSPAAPLCHAGEDAAVVALLGRVTLAETFDYLFVDHKDDLRAYLAATFGAAKIAHSLGNPKNAYWLALDQGLPVGYAKLEHPSPNVSLPCENVAQLQKIYVLRDFLGQGIGRLLLQAVLDRAILIEAPAVWLAVLQVNARAIAFYQAQGFAALREATHPIGAQTFNFRLMAWKR
jgi:ribosomal protein S18 acetylase RimI-like enzyme